MMSNKTVPHTEVKHIPMRFSSSNDQNSSGKANSETIPCLQSKLVCTFILTLDNMFGNVCTKFKLF